MDLSQTKRTTIERPAAPPGLDPNPQRVVPSGGAAREAAAGTLGSISGFPQLLRPKARIRRTFLVYACWHQLNACPGAVLNVGREVCVAERKSHDMHEF